MTIHSIHLSHPHIHVSQQIFILGPLSDVAFPNSISLTVFGRQLDSVMDWSLYGDIYTLHDQHVFSFI